MNRIKSLLEPASIFLALTLVVIFVGESIQMDDRTIALKVISLIALILVSRSFKPILIVLFIYVANVLSPILGILFFGIYGLIKLRKATEASFLKKLGNFVAPLVVISIIYVLLPKPLSPEEFIAYMESPERKAELKKRRDELRAKNLPKDSNGKGYSDVVEDHITKTDFSEKTKEKLRWAAKLSRSEYWDDVLYAYQNKTWFIIDVGACVKDKLRGPDFKPDYSKKNAYDTFPLSDLSFVDNSHHNGISSSEYKKIEDLIEAQDAFLDNHGELVVGELDCDDVFNDNKELKEIKMIRKPLTAKEAGFVD